MRSLVFSCLFMASALCVACGEPQLEGSGGKRTPGAINVDPDGIYRFGVNGETWINAANGDAPYGSYDLWTNSRNETLRVVPGATWTGGETAESVTIDGYIDLNQGFAVVPVIQPEAVPFLPGWWWYAFTYESDARTVIYAAMFIEAPRGFDTRVHVNGSDIGRQRAAAILQSLTFE